MNTSQDYDPKYHIALRHSPTYAAVKVPKDCTQVELCASPVCTVGPGSSASIASGYGLDGPGIEFRWGGEISRICPDRPWSPPSLLYNGYRVFLGCKERPGRDADPSSPSSVVAHERVELYLYSPYGPYGLYRASVPVHGWPLPYLYLLFNSVEQIYVNSCQNHSKV